MKVQELISQDNHNLDVVNFTTVRPYYTQKHTHTHTLTHTHTHTHTHTQEKYGHERFAQYTPTQCVAINHTCIFIQPGVQHL